MKHDSRSGLPCRGHSGFGKPNPLPFCVWRSETATNRTVVERPNMQDQIVRADKRHRYRVQWWLAFVTLGGLILLGFIHPFFSAVQKIQR